ncbi:cytochrome P450 [Nemania abortiva]|nr:cytochrome P450 [Nemania abortiva]
MAVSSLLAFCVSLVVSCVLTYASYLIFLHPLRKYPGPLLAKATDWFAGFHAFKKDLHLQIFEAHQKYGRTYTPQVKGQLIGFPGTLALAMIGPVVRLAPNRLVFNTAEAFQDIYLNARVSKAYTYGSSVRNNVDNVFTARDKDVHRAKRKIIAPALTERAAKSFEPSLTGHIAIYLRQVLEASKTSEPLNMTEKARNLALDIVTELSFGRSLDVQTSDENRFVSGALAFGLLRGNIWHHVYYLSRLWAYSLLDRVFFESREKYSRLLNKLIRDRVARGQDGRRDFYAFITEGSDTTATAMSATFFYLSRNRECYRKLAQEIRSSFASAEEIKGGPQLANCRYLRACIDEFLRMSPPVPGTLWRSQDPDDNRPLIINGDVIPKGTLFGVSSYALHHNEAYFPDSFTYKPERWLEARTPEKKLPYDTFAAFSAGPRSCAEKTVAYLKSSLMLARTLWYFDFETAPGVLDRGGTSKSMARPEEFHLEDIFTTRHDGP